MRPQVGRTPGDAGVSALGLLAGLVVLGILAAIALVADGHFSHHARATLGADTAVIAACRADFSAASTAVDAYQAELGQLPTTLAQIQPFLHDSLTTPQFSITLDATRPGQLLVATPGHPASPGAANCSHA